MMIIISNTSTGLGLLLWSMAMNNTLKVISGSLFCLGKIWVKDFKLQSLLV